MYIPKRSVIAYTTGNGSSFWLPVEMWQEILRWATMDDSDEFGDEYIHSGLVSSTIDYEQPTFFRYIPRAEPQRVYQDRLAVVLVCQVWYAIGVEFLWSHLELSRESWEHRSTNWISSLEPKVWTYVRRIDITFDTHYPEEDPHLDTFHTFLHDQVFPHLKQLQVLCAPQNLATGTHSLKPTLVFLYPGGHFPPDVDDDDRAYVWDTGNHFWTSAQLLDVELDMTSLPEELLSNCQEGDIIFQHLKRLCIRAAFSETIVSHITSHWKVPGLQALSLEMDDVRTATWMPLIEWARETITSLRIYKEIYKGRDVPSKGSRIFLPVLTSLLLERCFFTNLVNAIHAPLLAQLSFCDIAINRRSGPTLAETVTLALPRFPLCTLVVSHRYRDLYSDIDEDENIFFQKTPPFSFNPTDEDERALAIRNRWLLASLQLDEEDE